MSNPNPPNKFKKGEPRPAGAGRRPDAVNHLTTARVKTECKVRLVLWPDILNQRAGALHVPQDKEKLLRRPIGRDVKPDGHHYDAEQGRYPPAPPGADVSRGPFNSWKTTPYKVVFVANNAILAVPVLSYAVGRLKDRLLVIDVPAGSRRSGPSLNCVGRRTSPADLLYRAAYQSTAAGKRRERHARGAAPDNRRNQPMVSTNTIGVAHHLSGGGRCDGWGNPAQKPQLAW
jgi:hypothetical protein